MPSAANKGTLHSVKVLGPSCHSTQQGAPPPATYLHLRGHVPAQRGAADHKAVGGLDGLLHLVHAGQLQVDRVDCHASLGQPVADSLCQGGGVAIGAGIKHRHVAGAQRLHLQQGNEGGGGATQ